MHLGIFGFFALWSPLFIITILLMTTVYFLVTVKWRTKFEESEPLTKKQASFFIISMVLLYAIKGSPVEVMSTMLFSIHMTQMATLYLVFTPVLVLAIPSWIWRKLINLPVVKPLFSFATKPLIALVAFNIIFSIYHIPAVFDNVRTDVVLHGVFTFILFILAVFMWWPLLNPANLKNDLHGLKKIGYILGSAVLLTPACGLIIFADNPLYATYYDPKEWLKALALCVPADTLSGLSLSGPELFTSMTLEHDQQLGGVIMKIIQEIVFGYVLASLFFQWYKKDQAEADQSVQHFEAAMNPKPIE
ncbi:cytochrome c oxidase assembly factor CtaG [Bacillus sp. SCS-153A]|uniref:cytochrome c oxidase assembly factor CtaG n=1 Tax=Rossellomorea sedimentorum TaxID=3115294 RepID=UPI003905ADC6